MREVEAIEQAIDALEPWRPLSEEEFMAWRHGVNAARRAAVAAVLGINDTLDREDVERIRELADGEVENPIVPPWVARGILGQLTGDTPTGPCE